MYFHGKRLVVLAFLLGFIGRAPARAAVSGVKENRYLSLDLRTALILTLKYNLLLADLRLSPDIGDELIIREEAVFDPELTAGVDHKDSKTPRASRLLGTVFEEEQTNTSLGISKKFSTGATTSLSISNSRTDDSSPWRVLKPSHNSYLTLTLTQPLLKNFGWEVNRTRIKIAVNEFNISTLTLKDSIIREFDKTIKLYWDLVFAYRNKEVKEVLLKQAEGLLEMNKAKVEIGVLAPIVITEAQAGVASRQEAIILAAARISDLIDQLLAQTNLSGNSWDFLVTPTDSPVMDRMEISLKDKLAAALKYRPDYLSRLVNLKNQDLRIKYYDNQQHPDVNVYGSLGYAGLSDKIGGSWEDLAKLDYPVWSVGVNASYPLGNRKSSSFYLEHRLKKQRIEIQIKRLKQAITLDVRKAFRQLETGWKRILANQVAKRLEKEKLRIELEKLKLGKSTNQRVLDFQSDLAQAKINYFQAVIDYNKSLAELDRSSGTLLRKYNIEITGPSEGIDISSVVTQATSNRNKP